MPSNRSLTVLFPLLAALVLQGCGSTLELDSDYQPDFPFSQLQTYGWLASRNSPSADIRIDNDLVIQRVIAAVDHELARKGYRKSKPADADFLVTWSGVVDKKMRVDTYNHFHGSPWGGYWSSLHRPWGPGMSSSHATEYETGTLIIDFLTPEAQRLFWRGSGRNYLEEGLTPEEATASVNDTIRGILGQFPPSDTAAETAEKPRGTQTR
ncbi:MAG: DUF4136 domain-containing protein [Gammaproteobacteria bacterium]|nr:DUF4136 domain-containing protein [Gammaproteobacteria bacterium]